MGTKPPWFVLQADSLAGEAFGAVDWSAHPLGPPDKWPVALTTLLATTLADSQPTLLWWGKALWQFGNDAYLRGAQGAAGKAFSQGQPAKLCWPTSWPYVRAGLLSPTTGQLLQCDLEDVVHKLGRPANEVQTLQGGALCPVYGSDGRLAGARAIGAVPSAAVRGSQELHDVLERMTDAFVLLDAHWTIVQVNSQHARLSRLPVAEQLGRNFLDLFLRTPWGEQSLYWRNYHHCMQHQIPMAFDGYYAPWAMHTSCEVYPTAERGLAIFFRDITADREARTALDQERHKLEAVFRQGPGAMALVAGPQLRFEKVNARYVDLVGGRPLLGRSFAEAFPEVDFTGHHAIMEQVMRERTPYYAQERVIRMIRRKGCAPEDGYYDFSYHCIADGDGRPYGVYIHARDVTERVRSRQKLIDALRARDDLLSICSHELKTPVASMKLANQSFKRGLQRQDPRVLAPDRIQRMVDQSSRQLQRLERLIEEMLDFSRINGGRLQLSRKACDLADLARGSLERLRPQMEAAGTCASIEVAGEHKGEWDPFRLEQVLDNLVSNAVKYGAGKPIEVRLQEKEATAIVAVRDQGPGIDAKDHERIFRPFERAVPLTNISGLGLGLYISREIAEAHGGALQVRSAPGQGATFEVHLPRRPPQGMAGRSEGVA